MNDNRTRPVMRRWLRYKHLGEYTPFSAGVWKNWVSSGSCPVPFRMDRGHPIFDRNDVDRYFESLPVEEGTGTLPSTLNTGN